MTKSIAELNFTDPLEQFLSINLFPGCPINNWDSLRGVLFIGLILLFALLILYNSVSSTLFCNSFLFSKFQRMDQFFWIFPSLYIEDNLVKKRRTSISERAKINSSTKIYFLNILSSFIELNNRTFKVLNIFLILFVQRTLTFISGIIKENLHISKYAFFSIYYFSFLAILTFNVIGLLPYSITATSSFIMILNYSFSILVGLNIIGLYLHSTKYFSQFLPEGVPLFIAPVLVVIELFSNVIRIFSLTVRLFANILAGHSLLKILIGVSWSLISSSIFYLPIAIIVWLILTPIFFLECIIAFLQAYVYVLLLIIYTNDVINIH